jgi:hypothetical protein
MNLPTCEECNLELCSGCFIKKINPSFKLDCWIKIYVVSMKVTLQAKQSIKNNFLFYLNNYNSITQLKYVIKTYYPEYVDTLDKMILLK